MFADSFYHETIKKTIIGFGALFSNIGVIRRNLAGDQVEVVQVPVAFGPKEKFITRLDADPELNAGVFITLPRLAFEITGMNFRAGEMTNRNNKIQYSGPDGKSFIYTPVPYDLQIQLYALTKGVEDGLAIAEQILPLFTPEYTLTIDAVPGIGLELDFPIILNGVSVSDDYEGDFSTRRLVTHTFDFTARIKLMGPLRTSSVILRTESDIPGYSHHTSQANPITKDIIIDEWVLN